MHRHPAVSGTVARPAGAGIGQQLPTDEWRASRPADDAVGGTLGLASSATEAETEAETCCESSDDALGVGGVRPPGVGGIDAGVDTGIAARTSPESCRGNEAGGPGGNCFPGDSLSSRCCPCSAFKAVSVNVDINITTN